MFKDVNDPVLKWVAPDFSRSAKHILARKSVSQWRSNSSRVKRQQLSVNHEYTEKAVPIIADIISILNE